MRARQSRQKKLVRLATATAIRVRAHLATCKSSCRCGWMPPVAITSNECRGKKAHRHRTSSGEWWKLITRPAAGRLVNFHCLVFRSRDIAFCKKKFNFGQSPSAVPEACFFPLVRPYSGCLHGVYGRAKRVERMDKQRGSYIFDVLNWIIAQKN